MFDRPLNQAFISLGSNIEPERNLPAAVCALAEYGRVVAVSAVWETRAVGPQPQPNFHNAALLLETCLAAPALKETALAAVEGKLGRVRSSDRYAPRTIDLDLMLFNHEQFTLGSRRIPDPEMLAYAFVAIPLAELAPNYIHPETGQTLAAIARRFDPAKEGMRRLGILSASLLPARQP